MITMDRQQGFTLIEMLLSLAIFGMLGLATHSVLNSTMLARDAVVAQNDSLTSIQRAFTILESDFVQLAQRHARIDGEAPSEKLFHAEEYLFDSENIGFAFVKDGWTNPAMVLPRSEMQPVAYRLIEGNLQRLYFNFVDSDIGTEPRVQPMMEGIESITLDYFYDKEWKKELPENGLPKLIKFTLVTKTYGEISRTFPLIDVITSQSQVQG